VFGRHDVGLAAVGRLEVVVDDMIDHIVHVVTDHPAILDLAGDLAADTRRLLVLEADASVVVVLLVVLLIVVSSSSSSLSEDAASTQFWSQLASPR
jgi:hypothetical protein